MVCEEVPSSDVEGGGPGGKGGIMPPGRRGGAKAGVIPWEANISADEVGKEAEVSVWAGGGPLGRGGCIFKPLAGLLVKISVFKNEDNRLLVLDCPETSMGLLECITPENPFDSLPLKPWDTGTTEVSF